MTVSWLCLWMDGRSWRENWGMINRCGDCGAAVDVR
jgi:hypothetical protein